MVKTSVEWKGGMAFEGFASTGQTVVMDAAEEFGGKNGGMRPTELLLVALGGCTGMDVVAILGKKHQKPDSLRMEIEGDRRTDHPRSFNNIRIKFIFKGAALTEDAVRRAVELSQEKFCSFSATIKGAAKIEYTYKIER